MFNVRGILRFHLKMNIEEREHKLSCFSHCIISEPLFFQEMVWHLNKHLVLNTNILRYQFSSP